jgi:hypothetical protein
MVRIADGAGIQLEEAMLSLSQDFREDLGLDGFASNRSRTLGAVARTVAPVVRGITKGVLRIAGRRRRRSEGP